MSRWYSMIAGRMTRLRASVEASLKVNLSLLVAPLAMAICGCVLIIGLHLNLLSYVGVSLLACCLASAPLACFCKNKIAGGGYIFFMLLLCHVPAFWIARTRSLAQGIDAEQYFLQGGFFLGLLLVAFAFAVFLARLKTWAHGRLAHCAINGVAIVLLLLPGLCAVGYLLNWSFGNPVLRVDAVLAVWQTDWQEAMAYGEECWSPSRLVRSIALVAFVCGLAYKTAKVGFVGKTKGGHAFLAICLVAGAVIAIGSHANIVTAPFVAAHKEIRQYALFNETRKENVKAIAKSQSTDFRGTFVIVIGESLNRAHMGVYGYARDTTPWQSTIAKCGQTVIFRNAFSNHTHTVPVLSMALTQRNQYDHSAIAFQKAISLIDVAKYAAGFHTVWISNQAKLGSNDTPTASMASSADWQYFANTSYKRAKPDEILLEQIKGLRLTADNNLVVVHLMGSHGRYGDRYPQSFAVYGEEGDAEALRLNQYDDSVRYNDHVLKQIYELATKLPRFQGMLYFSDHGEDPVRGLGHNSAKFTWDMAKIPVWMIFSDDYIASHARIIANLRAHHDKPFTNDLIFDTVLGLLGLTDNEYYSSGNDLCSEDYHHTYADLKTLHGRKALNVLPDEHSMRKIWLHRVNSPQKLLELGEHYHGLEFDVIYHKDIDDFENSHDPGIDRRFTFENQLKTLVTINGWQDKSLWIDFKNLTYGNKIAAERRLRELFAKYNIPRDNCWVESQNWKELDAFRRNGWKTSYYFPSRYRDCMKFPDKREAVKHETIMIAESGNIDAISFGGPLFYDFITSLNLAPNIALLTWYNGVARHDFETTERYFPVITNPRIKGILVKEKGHYHR